MADVPTQDFKSPQDLRALLNQASRRLHFINRVSGESKYVWHLAQLIDAVGELADLIDDPEIKRSFGNGYDAGTLDRDAAQDRLLELLAERMRKGLR